MVHEIRMLHMLHVHETYLTQSMLYADTEGNLQLRLFPWTQMFDQYRINYKIYWQY